MVLFCAFSVLTASQPFQSCRQSSVPSIGNHAFAIDIEGMVRAFFGPLPIEIGATRLALEAEADWFVEHRVIPQCP